MARSRHLLPRAGVIDLRSNRSTVHFIERNTRRKNIYIINPELDAEALAERPGLTPVPSCLRLALQNNSVRDHT